MDDLDLVFATIGDNTVISTKEVCDYIDSRIKDDKCNPKSIEHWNKWMKEHERQEKKLGKATNRSIDKLLMNQRIPWQLKHEKALLEERGVIIESDKYRGHPNFWLTTDDVIGKHRNRGITKDRYPSSIDFTKYRSSTLGFGYFGQPDEVLKEQHLTKKEDLNLLEKWNTNPIVQNAKFKASENLDKMEPFKPDVDNLFINGIGYTESENLNPTTTYPKIVITRAKENDNEEDEMLNNCTQDPYSVSQPILQIGDAYVDLQSQFYCYVSFHCDQYNKNNKKTVTIKNKGTTAVHYKWQLAKCYQNNFPLKVSICNDEPKFFFDNTNGVILPGKSIQPFFIFKSSATGTFKQVWQFIIRPWKYSNSIFFILTGINLLDNINQNISYNEIDNYLNDCLKRTREIKELEKKNSKKQHTGLYKFDEHFTDIEKFEYNNPQLYYHVKEVALLKALYYKLKKIPWNYSIKDLYKVINRIKDTNLREKHLQLLQIIYLSLQQPPIYKSIPNNRYIGVYTLLCKSINKIETVFINLENVYELEPLPMTEFLYEQNNELLPEELNREDLCLAGEEKKQEDEVDKQLQKLFRKYLIPYGIRNIRIGTVTIPLNDETFKTGIIRKFRDQFDNILGVIEKQIEQDKINADLKEEDLQQLEKIQKKIQSISKISQLKNKSKVSTVIRKSKLEVDSTNVDHFSIKSKKGVSKASVEMEVEEEDERLSEENQALKDTVLYGKKFINYLKVKQKPKRIKYKIDECRRNVRQVFMYHCKIILTSAIDEISAFLASTIMLDNVLDVDNELIATHPKLRFNQCMEQ